VASPVERHRNVSGDEAPQGFPCDAAPPTSIEAAWLPTEHRRNVGAGGEQALIEVEVVGDLSHDT
jgi:hypothetical protein